MKLCSCATARKARKSSRWPRFIHGFCSQVHAEAARRGGAALHHNQRNQPTKDKRAMDIKRNGTQPSGKGPAESSTGTVRIDPLFKAPDPAPSAARASRSSPARARRGTPSRKRSTAMLSTGWNTSPKRSTAPDRGAWTRLDVESHRQEKVHVRELARIGPAGDPERGQVTHSRKRALLNGHGLRKEEIVGQPVPGQVIVVVPRPVLVRPQWKSLPRIKMGSIESK